jgi:hypothetical protein
MCFFSPYAESSSGRLILEVKPGNFPVPGSWLVTGTHAAWFSNVPLGLSTTLVRALPRADGLAVPCWTTLHVETKSAGGKKKEALITTWAWIRQTLPTTVLAQSCRHPFPLLLQSGLGVQSCIRVLCTNARSKGPVPGTSGHRAAPDG